MTFDPNIGRGILKTRAILARIYPPTVEEREYAVGTEEYYNWKGTKTVTKDNRSIICEIISEMLDNPNEHEIYPTTRCYDKLEEILNYKDIEINELKTALRLAAGELSTYGAHTTEHPEVVYNDLITHAKEQLSVKT